MLLACNRNLIDGFWVSSPLTEGALRVLYQLPNLTNLRVVTEKHTPLLPVALSSLIGAFIEYNNGRDWVQLFHRGTLGKLETVGFIPSGSAWISTFLEEFQKVALPARDTLSDFHFRTSQSWDPNYSSLFVFKQI